MIGFLDVNSSIFKELWDPGGRLAGEFLPFGVYGRPALIPRRRFTSEQRLSP